MKYRLASLLFIAVSWGIHATDPLSPVIETILENNPELQASKSRMASEISELRGENTLGGPEAEFEYLSGADDQRWSMSVGQEFEWPGVYSARNKAADTKANAFECLYLEQKRDMSLKIREAALNYLRAKQKILLLEKIDNNLESMSGAYDKALLQGKATAIEVRQLGIICFNLARTLADTKSELQEYAAELRTMNGGRDVEIPFTSIPLISLRDEADYLSMTDQSDPSVKASEALAKAAKAELSVVGRSSLPGFTLGYVHEYEDKEHFNGFSIGIRLPQWSNRHKKNKINHEIMALDFERLNYINNRTSEIKADYAGAKNLYELITKGKALFDDSYVNMLDKSMESGQIDLFTYLSYLNEFIDVRNAYLDIRFEYALLLARLNRNL